MSDKYAVPNKLPATRVSILAHRKKRINQEKSHHNLQSKNIRKALQRRKIGFHKAEYFVSKYLLAERDARRTSRHVVTKKRFGVPLAPQEKLIAVFRCRAKTVASDAMSSALKTLGVQKMNRVSLVEANVANRTLLAAVEPYVTYGFPDINTVRDLVFKHGFIKVDGKRVPIQSNVDVENQLGEYGIICVEDIVHELYTVGKNFQQVREILGSFDLNPPRDGWKNKRGIDFGKGGEFGNRKNEINELLARCM